MRVKTADEKGEGGCPYSKWRLLWTAEEYPVNGIQEDTDVTRPVVLEQKNTLEYFR